MRKNEIITFVNDNQACHLATYDGKTPRVRGIMVYRADKEGIIFHTGKFKDLFKQLSDNPTVEFCFNNFESGTQVRISGKVKQDENIYLKEEIVENRPFMKPWIEKEGIEGLAVFRMMYEKATIWTLATNFSPKVLIEM